MQDVVVRMIAINPPHVAEITLMDTPLTEREVGEFKELLERELKHMTKLVREHTIELDRRNRNLEAEYRRGHIDGYTAGIKAERIR